MIKNTLIIALVIALIYLYYQQKKPSLLAGNSADSEDTIRDLQTQLQQAQQLEKFNGQQLTRLQEQLATYQKGEDWETKTGEIITNLEKELGELTTERDEAVREKKTSEQELTSLSNKLKLKNQETTNKDQEIQRLKKEKSASEIALNKTITELRKKYSEREKLLDEEQTDNNKLTEENEKLQEQITELKRSKSPLPGSWDYEEELTQEIQAKDKQITELTKTQQDQLRAINLLFDPQAQNYEAIDFNGLHALLKGVAEREREREQSKPTPDIQPEKKG